MTNESKIIGKENDKPNSMSIYFFMYLHLSDHQQLLYEMM